MHNLEKIDINPQILPLKSMEVIYKVRHDKPQIWVWKTRLKNSANWNGGSQSAYNIEIVCKYKKSPALVVFFYMFLAPESIETFWLIDSFFLES